MSRRVGITGLGTICGLGVGIEALWRGLVEGRSCLARITRFDPSGFPCRLAGEVKNFAARDCVPKHYRKAVKVMARDIELAVGAAKCAVEDAGLVTRAALAEVGEAAGAEGGGEGGVESRMTYRPGRMGCHIGAGLIAADTEELSMALASAKSVDGEGTGGLGGVDMAQWGRAGMDNLTPLWLLKYLPNMLACHVTIIHGAEGPSNTITCAEASGVLCLGESMRVIERGAADLCFSGGAESKINLMGLLRMDLAGRVAHTGDAMDGASIVRPFDVAPGGPNGGLLGEGGGVLVLEEMECARARGARVYAEIAGFGAAHSSMWYEDGERDEGYLFAVESALNDAGVKPEQIDAVVPMGLGVESMDRVEAGAFQRIFGARLREIPLVTLCPSIGNLLAGSGAVQAAVAAKCLAEQRLPARLHGGRARDGLQAGASASAPARLEHVLVCTGSLGGQNGALVLKRAATVQG